MLAGDGKCKLKPFLGTESPSLVAVESSLRGYGYGTGFVDRVVMDRSPVL